jgi:hypothetical protein
MGLTIGCARCHNHKYDPFTQQEYYQLSAFFNSIPEDGRASNYGNSAPWIAAPTVEQQQKHTQLEQEIRLRQERLAVMLKQDALAVRRWEQSLNAPGGTHWFPQDNLLVHHALDENSSLVVNGRIARLDPARPNEEKFDHADVKKEDTGFRNGTPKFVSSPIGQAVEFDGRYYFDAGRTANFDYRDRLRDFKDNFAISIWIYPESDQSGAILTHTHEAASEFFNNLPNVKGWGLYFINGKAHFNLVNVWADDSLRVETARALPLNEWSHLLAVFDSTQPLDKMKIYLNGQPQKLVINNGRLFRSFGDAGRTLKIGAGGSTGLRFRGRLDEARVYKAIPDEDQLVVLACADSLEQIARIPPAKRSRGQRLKMQGAYLDKAAPEATREVWKKISELKQQRLHLEAEFSTLMVMREMPAPRPAFLLRRGAYDAPGEKVERGVPAALAPMPKTLPNNRLGLAKWLVSSEHPLTARVTVNHFWQMLFGAGLVKTTEDFGSQGELPTHPELLDYLAVEFQQTRWNVKALLKDIVMSATYRQSSQLTAQLLQRDPDNKLLARGARYRLSAEMIRDQALFVSGLLVEKLGGPSVKPYQPDGLWKDMTFSNMTTYHQEKGEGLWRRSLYTFWKRTILNPGMFVFDASAREHCTVRETRTNSPLQALNLMNDVTYVEAARLLAGRMIADGGATPEARVAWAFRLVTSRAPKPDERRILLSNLNSQLEYFRGQTEEAGRLLKTGEKRNEVRLDARELAAYTALASLLLNLDEVITKQ